nr:hypothetical protein [Tanacetum cinerariifolium]GFA60668.1 hypothetical protein [Tanacetum cinerariifolium]
MSLMHRWHDTIYGGVIGPRRSVWMHPRLSVLFSFVLVNDPRIVKGQATQTVIIHNAAYQADDFDAYDSDCDDLNSVKVTHMANLSYYGSDVLADVHNPNNIDNNMINQSVQAMPYSK